MRLRIPSILRGRWPRRIAETLAVLSGIIMIGILVLAGRLGRAPIDVGFARSYIQDALSSGDVHVSMDRLILTWPHLTGPFQLDVTGLKIQRAGVEEAGVDHAELKLSRIMLLAGRISPVSITLNRPRLHLVRSADNHVALTLEKAPSQQLEEKDSLAVVIQSLSQRRKIFDFGNPLGHLRRLEIEDATVTVEDHVLNQTWQAGPVALSFAHDPQGLVMTSSLRLPRLDNGNAGLFFNAIYRRRTNDYLVNMHVSNLDPRVLSRKVGMPSAVDAQDVSLTGDIAATLDGNLGLATATAHLAGGAGSLSLPTLYSKPLPYQALALDANYNRVAGHLDLGKFAVTTGGVTLTAAAHLVNANGQLAGPLMLTLPQITQAQIAALYPDVPISGARIWLTQKMSKGDARNVNASLQLMAGQGADGNWAANIDNIKGDFDISNATIDYRNPLWPAVGAHGHGHFEGSTLDIGIDGAIIGDLQATHGQVLIDRIGIHDGAPGTATITMHLAGPLVSVFKYVANEPIKLDASKIGMNLDAMRGAADADIGVSFPTIKNLPAADVKVTVNGVLTNVFLPHVVKDLDLAGKRFALNVVDGGLSLKGTGTLAGQPIDFGWQKFINSAGHPFSSQVTASLTTTDDIRHRLNLGIDPFLHGTAPAKIVYTDHGDGTADATVDGDMTPATLTSTLLDYTKPPGPAGHVTAQVLFAGGAPMTVQKLGVTAPNLNVADTMITFAPVNGKTQITSVSVPHATLNESNVVVNGKRDGDVLGLTVNGLFLDARPFLKHHNPSEPYSGPALDVKVTASKLRTRDDAVMANVKGDIGIDASGRLSSLSLNATAGAGPLSAQLLPNGGHNVLNVRATDAGFVLHAFSIYDNIIGGTLSVTGLSAPSDLHNIEGSGNVTDFRVAHAPVLAQMVNSLDLANIPAMLGGDGVHFAKLEGNFTWVATPKGDVITLTDGRTSGASLGLTFAGTVDKTTNAIHIKGDIVPVSGINGLLNGIPVINQVMTGGKNGGIFAATYAIDGQASNPDVHVNPLAILAPGILRKILFE